MRFVDVCSLSGAICKSNGMPCVFKPIKLHVGNILGNGVGGNIHIKRFEVSYFGSA